MRTFALLGVLLLHAPVLAQSEPKPAPPAPGPVPEAVASVVALEVFAKGIPSPLFLTSPVGDPRIFIVSKGGKVFLHKDGALDKKKPFLDVSSKLSSGYEQGLLGLAFHPQFAKNGLLYVHLTDTKGLTRVVEYHVSKDDPDTVDLSTERTLLLQEGKPYAGHNAALPVFGPDGKLYLATGDGGEGNKPNTGQNKDDYFGKLIRLDVLDPKAPLEVVAYGLRNPWRYSFDRHQGDLYIADVGHNAYEELNYLPVWEISAPHNFGWSVTEGSQCFRKKKTCDLAKYDPPTLEYDHKTGCSITGGYVYRGKAIPELAGHYFYADFCSGLLRSLRIQDGAVTDHWDWKPTLDEDERLAGLVSFGEDSAGELYLLSMDGIIYKFVRSF